MAYRYSYTHGVRLNDELAAIDIGARVFIPRLGLFGVIVEREEGERILGYLVRVRPGEVVRLGTSELFPTDLAERVVR